MFLRQAADSGAEAIVNVASLADLYAAMQQGWTGEDYGTADLYVRAVRRRRSSPKAFARQFIPLMRTITFVAAGSVH